MLVLAALVAVGAFLVLRPDDEDDAPEQSQKGTPRATPAVPPEQTTTQTQPEKPPEPEIPTIRVRGGKPVGGIQTIEAKQGDTVRFRVLTETPQEVHLHGYDITKNTKGGSTPVEFQVKAKETGVFEIELERSHTQIAELKVEP